MDSDDENDDFYVVLSRSDRMFAEKQYIINEKGEAKFFNPKMPCFFAKNFAYFEPHSYEFLFAFFLSCFNMDENIAPEFEPGKFIRDFLYSCNSHPCLYEFVETLSIHCEDVDINEM